MFTRLESCVVTEEAESIPGPSHVILKYLAVMRFQTGLGVLVDTAHARLERAARLGKQNTQNFNLSLPHALLMYKGKTGSSNVATARSVFQEGNHWPELD
jgi:hypothetical protein